MEKTVLITGASSGLGKEAARLFLAQGWNVIAALRSPEKEMDLRNSERLRVLPLDVTDLRSIQEAVDAGIFAFGSIDVLVNSAGYGLFGVFESATPEQVRRQYEVNVFGVMNVTQAVLPQMRKNKFGVIINISSFGGVVASPFASLYNSSKFAVEGFSEALAHELAFLGIVVKIVEPGAIATNFRAKMEMIASPIEAYHVPLVSFVSTYPKRTEHLTKASAADVARTIYEAATDNQSQLRYVVAADAQFYIDLKARDEQTLRQIMRGEAVIMRDR
jgi:NAD(P)-dependent dehydrogenase (short-subunit alcohol dehydrogenase family)